MTEQQVQQEGLTVANGYNISELLMKLLDIQNLIRVIPGMQARIDALLKIEADLKAQLADAETRIAALSAKTVESASDDESKQA